MERMTVPLCEIKFANEGAMEFSGYGAVFGNVDSYGDVIAPGAFAETLHRAQKSGRWPAMLSQHGAMGLTSEDLTPVGVWASLSEDGKGLVGDGVLAPTPRGQELHTLMKMKPRPAIDGLSIGYIAKKWTPRTKPDEPRRVLHEIDLIEISPVTFPANGKARLTGVKSFGDTERDIERWLTQDAGLTRREARIAINQGFKALLGMQDATGELSELADALKKRGAVFG